jgi:N-acetylglucosaminyldiphosphoundecaprenol N-acetyl-beta-D-mannosaminyltransferase
MNVLGIEITTELAAIPLTASTSTRIINTINPHSYVLSKKDIVFQNALNDSDHILPDGIGIVLAAAFLKRKKIQKIAGSDLHEYLLNHLNSNNGFCFYLGSSPETLCRIKERVKKDFPGITAGFYAPPFRTTFSEAESNEMIAAFNNEIAMWRKNENSLSTNRLCPISPILFIGMTAPKQEKWSFQYKNKLEPCTICNIGAVFDFFAGTVKRPSSFWIRLGLEWLPRLLCEPQRLYKRMFISAPVFVLAVLLLKFRNIFNI